MANGRARRAVGWKVSLFARACLGSCCVAYCCVASCCVASCAAQQIPPGTRPGAPAPPSPLPVFGLRLPAGTQLPATAPSTAPPPAVSPVSAPAAAIALPARRPRVTFADGQLLITADDASLNQILREIARVTGMRITGGVADERVFGTYGPGETGAVLTVLLNGTGSNMMLSENANRGPEELVLTPRQGGPTPPNPMAGRDDAADDLPPQLTPRVSSSPAVPAQTAPEPATQPSAGPPSAAAADATNAAAANAATTSAATTTVQSPNGVKTPRQIFDELMKLQQQQAKTPAPQ